MTILVAIDDSDPAREALEYALGKFPDQKITVVHVITPPVQSMAPRSADYDEVAATRREQAEELIDETKELAGAYDATIETEILIGEPARGIVQYAEEHDVEQVILGSHGRTGPARVLLGSVAEKVVRRSPVPVTVVR